MAAAAGPNQVGSLPVVRLFGLDFIDDVDTAATVEHLVGPQPADGRLPLVVTPNVDQVVQCARAELSDVRHAQQRARYVLPDGQPIVWTSRLAGTPLRSRLAGSELFPPLWRRLIADRRRVVLVTPTDDAARGLLAEYPDAAAWTAPWFDAEDRAASADVADRVTELVQEHRAEFVFIGLGCPKQDRLAASVLERLATDDTPPPLVLLVGASFNMHLGIVPPAPEWTKRLGLEWFYRFLCEPRRLFRRYFVTDVQFLPMMVREVRRVRRIRRR
jgi:N-acetylglucosaminyldiphosphoundecaprenol N-acetyl-beta-D-mannosaminyltransferase